MTKNPMCVTADTSAQDALNLMVSRGFRHLVNSLYIYKKKSFDLMYIIYSLFVMKKVIFSVYSI